MVNLEYYQVLDTKVVALLCPLISDDLFHFFLPVVQFGEVDRSAGSDSRTIPVGPALGFGASESRPDKACKRLWMER